LNPYGLVCAGLIVLLDVTSPKFLGRLAKMCGKTAYEVSGRSTDILNTIDDLSFRLRRIRVIAKLPEDLDSHQLDETQCAALDLLNSILKYIGHAIQYFQSGSTSKFQ